VVFFLAVYLFYPYRDRFEFDLDEGGEAMKSLLVARGYRLFSEIYSDQPPVMTYLLAACIKVFGPEMNAGRTLILLFSAVLMTATVQFLYTSWGVWHALAGAVLLFLLPFYNFLSAALMYGLPAISFAMLSLLALSMWHRRRQDRWLVLSAIALALSVHTKLFTGFLAPIFLVGLLLHGRVPPGERLRNWRSQLRPVLIWSAWFGGVVLGILLIAVGPANIGQLIFPHLEARQLSNYISQSDAYPISVYLSQAWPLLLLAPVGLVFIALERRWVSMYLVAWVVVAYLMLAFHAPVWYHHQLLVSIPAAMLAAIAAGEALRWLPKIFQQRAFLSRRSGLVLLVLAGIITTLVVRLPATLSEFYRSPVLAFHPSHQPWAEQMFLTRMSNHAQDIRWVVTDLPMYAFRTGLLVPPNLSFITGKSLSTGDITDEQIIHTIDQYRPELVLLGRREYPAIKQYLQEEYRVLYARGKRDLLIRKDIKGQ
jgi:4-amino-4-deoxy-L-arabinose transferase-like glycosyltransferase